MSFAAFSICEFFPQFSKKLSKKIASNFKLVRENFFLRVSQFIICSESVCVCKGMFERVSVCVCVREREREMGKEKQEKLRQPQNGLYLQYDTETTQKVIKDFEITNLFWKGK